MTFSHNKYLFKSAIENRLIPSFDYNTLKNMQKLNYPEKYIYEDTITLKNLIGKSKLETALEIYKPSISFEETSNILQDDTTPEIETNFEGDTVQPYFQCL
ncbi:hypothetical protein Glove_86g166 [Diversispora epigaea]|uniref:Uncharacterized protein n=1 Tax=Diversispora epigaea TaxID=1348612 RepID=A0A397J6L6_9GLOM|nr:hypothetical protein Glove_86g166 [Diversispora epigaea]